MRLATFNLMSGRSLSDGRIDPARLGPAIGSLHADLLGLQEVDRAQPRSGSADLTALAADASGLRHRLFVPALVGTPGKSFRPALDSDRDTDHPHYGIALLSRWPVRSWRVLRLPPAPIRGPVYLPGGFRMLLDEPRVVIAATLDTPRGPLTIATTHLSFVPGWNAFQLRRVVAALRELPGPRILMGDLNLPGRLAAGISGWRSLASVPTWPSPAPKIQFDHVLLDRRGNDAFPEVCGVSTPAIGVSDHRPVLVDLSD